MKLRRGNGKSGYGAIATVCALAVATFIGCRGDYGTTTTTSSGGNDFLATGRTKSFFTAIQVDPRAEDSAGPQFVASADLDGDGLMDLVSAWNDSQPVQIHLQRRSASGEITFETVTLAGNVPVVSVSGLEVADFDADGANDIAVMMKSTLEGVPGCLDAETVDAPELGGLITLYMGPTDRTQANQALAWAEIPIESSRLAGSGSVGNSPEEGGFTSMVIGDVDADGDQDIVAAWNTQCGGGAMEVLMFTNGGSGAVRDGTWSPVQIPNVTPLGTSIKAVALGDIDGDSDLDIVATFPGAGSMNVRWFRNPVIDIPDDFHFSGPDWAVGTVAQVPTSADILEIADMDADGLLDVVVRSTNGQVIQWLRGPGNEATTAPLPNISWQVYTLAEFVQRPPGAMALGDLNFDGRPELISSAGGALIWFDAPTDSSVYDQWPSTLIIDDDSLGTLGNTPATTDPNVSPGEVSGTTVINSIEVVDLDGDGANDLVVTLDRNGLSGITNDALVWLRNTQTPR